MSSHNRIIFSLLLSFVICSSLAQQKANKKCAEYLKIPNNFQKIGLGIIGGSLSFNNEFPHMTNLSNKEQKIENDKDVGGNTESKKKEISKMSVKF
ncbi:hypothetical protein MTP99_015907 [Tenebrio molitor]|nr:hypothetical protein MTP99_015907 [Tenebrio molitor]